jgi:hypothetical protein
MKIIKLFLLALLLALPFNGYAQQSTTYGDVNGDNEVNIADVTALIDYLLSQDSSYINVDNADVYQDQEVNIADVTALIDYLLSGTWN